AKTAGREQIQRRRRVGQLLSRIPSVATSSACKESCVAPRRNRVALSAQLRVVDSLVSRRERIRFVGFEVRRLVFAKEMPFRFSAMPSRLAAQLDSHGETRSDTAAIQQLNS